MNAQIIGWFVLLTVMQNVYCDGPVYFKTVDTHLEATEGSCAEIKCTVTTRVVLDDAHWFWMKDPRWNERYKRFDATIIYSSDESKRPVSVDYKKRITYIGSTSSSWSILKSPTFCSILICNLKKTDSGMFAFRFISSGTNKWATHPVNLTVTENQCPITFEEPDVATEAHMITLTCSTLNSCPSNPQIKDPGKLLPEPSQSHETQKSTTVTILPNWEDDGRQFSCQTQDNQDPHLIQNISLTVEYAPKEALATKQRTSIREGQAVTLTCSAKARPTPTFTWIKNGIKRSSEAKWTIWSIKRSESGNYSCKVENKLGIIESRPVVIDVTYPPQLELKRISPASDVEEGDEMILKCEVKAGNPRPSNFMWYKTSVWVGPSTDRYHKVLLPEDSGSYKCSATNSAGKGTSSPLQIQVTYGPRRTDIFINGNDGNNVKLDQSVTFTCFTDAYPAPHTYSWSRYGENKPLHSSQWESHTTWEGRLTLQRVQRTDEACYVCNATNRIKPGEDSRPKCIRVVYPPTNLKLSMDPEVREGQRVTITCTVESFPQSQLSMSRRSSSSPQPSETPLPQPDAYQEPNTLRFVFNATSAHIGAYVCTATNSEGSQTQERKLVVKYRPKDVAVRAEPGFTVKENHTLKLSCGAESYPELTSFMWTKTSDGKSRVVQRTQSFLIKSASSSDSGRYRCDATNEVGTGESQPVEVKVKHGPKHTKVTAGAEKQQPDGTSTVTVSCSSLSYPTATYLWYKKMKAGQKDVYVVHGENLTVNSEKAGDYYCVAENEMGKKASDPVRLFDRSFRKALKYFFLFLILLLIIIVIVFVYRKKKRQSAQQRTAAPSWCFGFMGGRNHGSRDLMNEPVIVDTSRSRDDLLPQQQCRPKAQCRQYRPDNTPVPNISSAYCTVNLQAGNQAPAAQKPNRQRGGRAQDESLNYASLHFGDKQKNKKAEVEEVVYSVVSKPKGLKNEQEILADYENVDAMKAAGVPSSGDTDTSEDEVELTYSRVNFTAKTGPQTAGGDDGSESSTSDEDETQYSDVKI